MLEGNLMRVIPLVALPQILTMLIDSLYNMADMFFVSQLGMSATAAVGINDALMQIIRAMSLAFGIGASSYISRLLGAKKDDEASRAASTTMITAMAAVAAVAAAMLCFLSPLVELLGATPDARAHSLAYAKWTLLFSPITAGSVCLAQTLRGEGSTTYSMIGSVSGCVVNVALDPLFISTLSMGVAGAAIATGISKIVSFAVLLYPYITHRAVLRMSLRLFSPCKSLYLEIARIGIPTAIRSGMLAVSTIIINNLAAGFGDAVLAAASVSNKSMKFISSAIIGFGQGFQPVAGFCWGAKRYGRVKKAYLITCGMGITLSLILGTLLFIFASEALSIFTDQTDMAEMTGIGVLFIRSQCSVLSLHMISMITSSMFNGLGKALRAGVLALARQVIVLIPCLIILTLLFGATGLAVSQAAADVISAAIATAMAIPMMRELDALEAAQKLN